MQQKFFILNRELSFNDLYFLFQYYKHTFTWPKLWFSYLYITDYCPCHFYLLWIGQVPFLKMGRRWKRSRGHHFTHIPKKTWHEFSTRIKRILVGLLFTKIKLCFLVKKMWVKHKINYLQYAILFISTLSSFQSVLT